MMGCQLTLLAAVKGLPLAYNKDMQETQEPLFDAAITASACVEVATGFMQSVKFDRERMSAACETGFLMNALSAATYLVGKGIPFREAHEVIAHTVQKCLVMSCELQDLSLEELREFSPAFAPDVYEHLKIEAVLACLDDVQGGTAPHQVAEGLRAAREKLAALQEAYVTNA